MARRKVELLSHVVKFEPCHQCPTRKECMSRCRCCLVLGPPTVTDPGFPSDPNYSTRKAKPAPESVLVEAARLVDGDRQEAYGHPKDNHACTAQLWTAYLRRCGVLKDDAEITPRQVCIANALQKCSRDAHEEKRDNLVDLAGWAANAEMVDE